MSNELTDVRCPCGDEYPADSYDAGFIAGSGMCQNCDAALPPKDICTCPSGDGSLRWPCPKHPAVEQVGANVGHGHVFPRADGVKMQCGGPGLCSECAADAYRARATLAQPSPVSEALIYACKNLAQITSSDGSGHADIAMAVLRMAGVGDDERERLVNEWKAARAWKPSPGQAEKAEAERPEVVAYLFVKPDGTLSMDAVRHKPSQPAVAVMTVAQHERIVKAWIERWKAYIELSAKIAAQRDAALARVAELELKLDQSDYAYDNDRHHMRGMAKQAAEAIQVFTGHDSGANLAHRYGEKWWEHLDELRDALLAFAKNAPPAQAQHSVPEEFSFEYRHPNGECHTVTVSREQVINEMPDFLFEALCSKFCNCEPVGETNVVEYCCDEYAEEFKLIAAAPGKEVGHE